MKIKILFRRISLLSYYIGLAIFGTAVQAQNFGIGHTTITFIDPERNNRSIATEIYYPADSNGNDVAFTTANSEMFPVLTFGHGFVMSWDAYENIWTALVPNGYIMAFPKTEGGLSPSHLEFAKDIAFVAAKVSALGQDANSIFFNRTSGQKVVMGHSMGGGAAYLAANLTPGLTALVTLAAAETNPSAIEAAAEITVPSLVFAGANDCVTAPATNQLAMYQAFPGSCKTYIEIIGGSHCQMADSNFFCNFGEATCSPAPTISREEQHLVISNYLIKWLNAKLKSDCVSGTAFDSQIETDSAITFEKNCTLCEILSVAENTNSTIAVYPNPFNEILQVQSEYAAEANFVLYDLSMRKIFSKKFKKTLAIPTENWNSGIYFYTIKSDDGSSKSGKIIKN